MTLRTILDSDSCLDASPAMHSSVKDSNPVRGANCCDLLNSGAAVAGLKIDGQCYESIGYWGHTAR
jgi:hypothetical protein